MPSEPPSSTTVNLDRIRRIAQDLKPRDGALLPILQTVQAEFGYIHDDAIPVVADALNLTRAEVFGVVSFYHDFRRTPPPQHVIRLCRAEACQSAGGEALAERAVATVEKAGIAGDVSVEAVYCLGLCAVAPAAVIDGRLVGRLDADRLDALLGEVAVGK